jgi:L-arabinose transport system substrate-binding protein
MKKLNLVHLLKYCTIIGAGFLSFQTTVRAEDVKIGFVVKQPEEPWFQDEWRFADQAAKEKNFTVVKIGAENGEKVMSAIDNLASQQAQGFIICVPDVKLGPAVVAKATADHLKLMTVDDQLVDGKGSPISTVPHMGISAHEIGKQVGQAIVDEIKKRGWNMQDVGAIRVTYEVSFGLNDEAVLGAVRAAEGRGLGADKMIGVGIGGAQSAINEFNKPNPTGFFGTVLISPKRHGYETSSLMYNWITQNQEPPKLTLTSGKLMNRDNLKEIRQEFGL